jgi:ABC-type oligopeptide transport system substrate-binding subunit
MNRTRRTIGLSVFVMLVVLGTGWALERKASSNSHRQGGAEVTEPAKSSEPSDVKPAATDSNQEYDRSDLLLSQG